jgi:hypothetical protein
MATNEKAHVLIGGIPYPVNVVPARGIPGGAEVAMLLEDVAESEEITADFRTSFFASGTTFVCRWLGERHITTGHRVLVMADPRTGEPWPENDSVS